MANENLNPHTFHEGYLKRLRAAERELERVEKRVRTLASRHEDIRQRKSELDSKITDRERQLAGLQSERNDLLGAWATATFEDDQDAMSTIQTKRAELDKTIAERETDIRSLRTSLDALEDTQREAAELRVRLEQLNHGNAYSFATELRNILVRHELGLKSRKSKAERTLPTVDLDTLELVREEEIPGYLEKKQAQQEELERAKQKRARQEQELKDRTSRQYIGAGQGGNRRAATIGEATKKIRETRGQ
jgi:chromosome segregation ATPase